MSPSSPSKGANALAELSAQLAGAVEASATSVVAIQTEVVVPEVGCMVSRFPFEEASYMPAWTASCC